MAIKLNIEIVSPLSAEDQELLTGVAIMTLSIANHQLAKARFPETFDEPEESTAAPGPEYETCGFTRDGRLACVRPEGHRGRHRLRDFALLLSRPEAPGMLS